ncbi:MAG: response regulator [Pseudomonadota bacterium]
MTDDNFVLEFNEEQIQHMKKYGGERRMYTLPTILIVEDQTFSRNLIEGMLMRNYTCYSAANVKQAISLYAEHIPCIVFLDIELPDGNGHEFASLIKKHDPDSFIVMVTANSYEQDVARAVENKAQGFVIKPYSRQKIMLSIEKYVQERKLRKIG